MLFVINQNFFWQGMFCMIKITNIKKSFGTIQLIFPEIEAKQGEIVLLVGPSGSGKTIFCEMLVKFCPAEAGDFQIHGRSYQKLDIFKEVHYICQEPEHNLIGITCWEDLRLWNSSLEALSNVLQLFNLSEWQNTPIWKLSFGQKKKLALCGLILVQRPIWIIDEPFAGLDEQLTLQLKIIMQHFLQNGGLIIATSHNKENFNDSITNVYEI